MRGSKHEKNRKRKRKSRQQAIATEQDDMDNITTGGTLRSAVKRGAIDFIATTKSDTTDIPTTSCFAAAITSPRAEDDIATATIIAKYDTAVEETAERTFIAETPRAVVQGPAP